jgi:hypothetical protein
MRQSRLDAKEGSSGLLDEGPGQPRLVHSRASKFGIPASKS